MIQFIWMIAMIGVTIICYYVARQLYGKVRIVLFLPIVLASVILILLFTLVQIPYERYMEGAQWIHALLGPAVVSLAYPLYMQRKILMKLAMPILVGSFIGAVVGVVSTMLIAPFLQISDVLLYTVLPKSVTTPIAMDISSSLGGISSLAAVLVIIAGITGVVSSRFLFKLFRIDSEVGQGVAFGAASHAIGTSKALEVGELEGSISTIAMIVSAIFVSIITPLVVIFFQ